MLQQSTPLERLHLALDAFKDLWQAIHVLRDELRTQEDRSNEQDRRLRELERWRAEVDEERNWTVSQVRHLQHLDAEKQELEDKIRWYEDGL